MERHLLCLTRVAVGFAPEGSFVLRIPFIRFHAALEATQVVVQRNARHVSYH